MGYAHPMPRPREYDRRIDTKVRLRADHADLLKTAEGEGGLSRNRQIELALDAWFGIRSTAPKLITTPASPILQRAQGEEPTRTSPRLAQVGPEHEAQAKERAALSGPGRPPRTPKIGREVQPLPKTGKAPRRPYG